MNANIFLDILGMHSILSTMLFALNRGGGGSQCFLQISGGGWAYSTFAVQSCMLFAGFVFVGLSGIAARAVLNKVSCVCNGFVLLGIGCLSRIVLSVCLVVFGMFSGNTVSCNGSQLFLGFIGLLSGGKWLWVVFVFGRCSCVFVGGGDKLVVFCLLNVQRCNRTLNFVLQYNNLLLCYDLNFINNLPLVVYLISMSSTFLHT